jgi:hypothetical protein
VRYLCSNHPSDEFLKLLISLAHPTGFETVPPPDSEAGDYRCKSIVVLTFCPIKSHRGIKWLDMDSE